MVSEEEVAAAEEIEAAAVVEIAEAVVEIEVAVVEIVEGMAEIVEEAVVMVVPAAISRGHHHSNGTSKKNVKSLVLINPKRENERKQHPQQIRVKLWFNASFMHPK